MSFPKDILVFFFESNPEKDAIPIPIDTRTAIIVIFSLVLEPLLATKNKIILKIKLF